MIRRAGRFNREANAPGTAHAEGIPVRRAGQLQIGSTREQEHLVGRGGVRCPPGREQNIVCLFAIRHDRRLLPYSDAAAIGLDGAQAAPQVTADPESRRSPRR